MNVFDRRSAFHRTILTFSFFVLCIVLASCSVPNAPLEAEEALVPTTTATAVNATPTPVNTPTPVPTVTPSYLATEDVPPLDLDAIFDPRDLDELQLDPERVRTVIATGDVIPARSTDAVMRKRDDFVYPVRETKDILRGADLTVINLEAPIIKDCPTYYPDFTFCGRPPFMEALEVAGVDVATLENNHIDNYGRRGIEETIERLEDAEIAWADRSTAAIMEVRGLKFGFLAFTSIYVPLDLDAMREAVQELRREVDVVIVAAHWGDEYVRLPQPAPSTPNQDPLDLAHAIIDAGADLIIGNHAHWVQPVEIYDGKLITYGHGNFIFDQMFSYDTRVSVIGRYTFYDDTLIGVEFIPTAVENYAQPVPLEGDAAQDVIDMMRTSSERWARVVAGEERRPYGDANKPRLVEPSD
jgi:poly-gamma-glutamate synthesis protein (capsule biosynthesis protein)